jgi:hypothetical protein
VEDLASRIIRVCGEQFTQIAEVVLEPARSDDLDDAAELAAGVSHCVHLAAWFGDVTTGTEDHLAFVGAEADLARDDDRVFVLSRVPVRRGEHADREGMLDDGHLSPVCPAGQLDHGPEAWHRHGFALSGLHHGDLRPVHIDYLTHLLARPKSAAPKALNAKPGRLRPSDSPTRRSPGSSLDL